MRVSIVHAPAVRYTPGADARYSPGTQPQQPGQPEQRWYYRQASPTLTRPPAPQVVRHRRATLATASPEVVSRAPLVMTAPRPEREAPPPQQPAVVMPAPLPSVWRNKYELCPDTPSLGGGAFAEVFKVRHVRTWQCFAVKVMHRPNFELRGIEKQIDAEIMAMRLATDLFRESRTEGHVVQILDVAEEFEYVFLLLELCEQGDLLRKLHLEPVQRFAESLTAVWARQLFLGLRTLHSLGYIHRDIKPDNLLCSEAGVLKIADLGWCSTLEEKPTCLAGTFVYMAPEVLQNVVQTEQVDVWSTGVSLYQMLVGRPLLTSYLGPGATQLTETDPHGATAMKQRRLLEEIAATCPPSLDRRPSDISPICWDFLQRLLIPDPRLRLTVDGALRHPWLYSANPVASAEPLAISAPAPAGVKPEKSQASASVAEDTDAAPLVSEPIAQQEKAGQECADEAKVAEPPKSPPRHRRSSGGGGSPVRGVSKGKDARSPSTGKSSIDNVPTPLKPRSWDANRNIAYTPPAQVEQEKENASSPQRPSASPEPRKSLLLSADRALVAQGCGETPKDTLLDRFGHVASATNNTAAAGSGRAPLARLSPPAPPPRSPLPRSSPTPTPASRQSPQQPSRVSLPSRASHPACGRRNGASTEVAAAPRPLQGNESPEVSGVSRPTQAMRQQPSGINPQAAKFLLRKLHNCNEQLRQIQAAMVGHLQRDNSPGTQQPWVTGRRSAGGALDRGARAAAALRHGAASPPGNRRGSTGGMGLGAGLAGSASPPGGDRRSCSPGSRDVSSVLEASAVSASTSLPPHSENLDAGTDVLMATCPPQLGGPGGNFTPSVLRPARMQDATLRASEEALHSARGGRENAPPCNLSASTKATMTSTVTAQQGKQIVRNGIVYAATASPLKARQGLSSTQAVTAATRGIAGQPPPQATSALQGKYMMAPPPRTTLGATGCSTTVMASGSTGCSTTVKANGSSTVVAAANAQTQAQAAWAQAGATQVRTFADGTWSGITRRRASAPSAWALAQAQAQAQWQA